MSIMPKDVQIARDDETRAAIARFRYEIYVTECGRELQGTDHRRRVLEDTATLGGMQLYVRKEDRIVGTVSLSFGGSDPIGAMPRSWFGLDRFDAFDQSALCFAYKLMVAKDWRSSSVAHSLVDACYQLARAHGVEFSFCGASPGLVPLYEAMGFRRYKDNIHVDGLGYQVPMVCVVQDVEYFRAAGAIFQRSARRWPNTPETGQWFSRAFPQGIGYARERMLGVETIHQWMTNRLNGADVRAFRGLTDDDVDAVLGGAVVLHCREGDRLITRGQRERDLFIVVDGELAVDAVSGGVHVDRLVHPGGACGEREFLNDHPRGDEVRATRDSTVLVLPHAAVTALARTHGSAVECLLDNLRADARADAGAVRVAA